MENEIMNYEENEVMIDDIMEDEGAGIGAGVAMLIGAGLTLAVGAGVKLAKKGIAAWKEKKALRQPDEEITVEAEQIEEIVTPDA